jgi:hypothetical protein
MAGTMFDISKNGIFPMEHKFVFRLGRYPIGQGWLNFGVCRPQWAGSAVAFQFLNRCGHGGRVNINWIFHLLPP